jgi:hypothetical protein
VDKKMGPAAMPVRRKSRLVIQPAFFLLSRVARCFSAGTKWIVALITARMLSVFAIQPAG